MKGFFLTPKDLMFLYGSDSYNSCANQHKNIRECIEKGKRKLTIKEYCEYEKIDFKYIWEVLRK
ncbi:MAG TPA: hypothetical protein VNX01_00720, partial [Bacteroidia bacterium]|jgi:hypothetical protein|nr:hypothetical protein [Bacteroidia bacterium]